MGIKTGCPVEWQRILGSEKPPHHMGIKTFLSWGFTRLNCPLKNLPTTWGLRLLKHLLLPLLLNSEKPPHHMGIKT